MAITALIVDDEELARENLSMLLESFCPNIKIIGLATSKEDAKIKIAELKPQVVFLDICMPSGVEGLNLLDELPQKDFLVIFVTAFKEYAIKAFNANAVHYLLKPIDVDELIDAAQKIEERLGVINLSTENKEAYHESVKNVSASIQNKDGSKITISHMRGVKIIDQKDIVYLKADGNCTVIHFNDGTKYTDTRTLKSYNDLLNNKLFFRTHKSYLINLSYLKEYVTSDGTYAVLKNNVEVPVSRSKTKDFLAILKSI
jgi:two-component system LytT family response regulator